MEGFILAHNERRYLAAAALLVLGLAAWAAFLVVRAKAYLWLPDYARHVAVASRSSVPGTRHVLFLVADHYEPGVGAAGAARNREWLTAYRELAGRHRDSYGRTLQHTWFYAYDHHNDAVMRELSRAVYEGLGEVEFHWHHGNDTNETFPLKLADAVTWFQSFGAMVSADGRTAFGFIHGNWALDDSRRKELCGVRRELTFLKAAGCYADFTFPSAGNESQPRKVNSIYYAYDDDGPKSYDGGVDAEVGRRQPDGLMIFEGPLALKLGWEFTDAGELEVGHEAAPERVDRWVAGDVHVIGRPEWIFVKAYTHGSQSRRVFFSPETDRLLTHLEERYRSGAWRLHYVTAREAYNIARAAEDGLGGDPDLYRDYDIPRPVNALRRLD